VEMDFVGKNGSAWQRLGGPSHLCIWCLQPRNAGAYTRRHKDDDTDNNPSAKLAHRHLFELKYAAFPRDSLSSLMDLLFALSCTTKQRKHPPTEVGKRQTGVNFFPIGSPPIAGPDEHQNPPVSCMTTPQRPLFFHGCTWIAPGRAVSHGLLGYIPLTANYAVYS